MNFYLTSLLTMWNENECQIKLRTTLEQLHHCKLSIVSQFKYKMPTMNMRDVYPHIKITRLMMINLDTQKQIKIDNQTQKIKIKVKKDTKIISKNINK